ncbi:MAG: hypothetical protein V7629_18660 [Motiliproteus sp.]
MRKNEKKFKLDKGDGFFRRTGEVKNRRRGRLRSYRFIDFDAYVINQPDQYGTPSFTMVLVHRYQNVQLPYNMIGSTNPNISEHYLGWEFLQRFMDVTQPLPDVPELEPYRQQDPTTVGYDQAQKKPRPERFWRDMGKAIWQKKYRDRYRRKMNQVNWQTIPDRMLGHVAGRETVQFDVERAPEQE